MNQSSLDPESYTAQRLQHATPEHLHLTTRRCFIGPVPEGWLKSHRRDWYKHHLHINYSSRAATFTAPENTSHSRRTTGLDTPRVSRDYRPSFLRPKDTTTVKEEEEGDLDGTEVAYTKDGTFEGIHAITVPRSSNPDSEIVNSDLTSTTRAEVDNGSKSGILKSKKSPNTRPRIKKRASDSFVTASEGLVPALSPQVIPNSPGESSRRFAAPEGGDASTSSLLPHTDPDAPATPLEAQPDAAVSHEHASRGAVQFSIPDEPKRAELQAKARLRQMSLRRATKKLRRSDTQDGQILKMEKMLVRVETTLAQLDDEFDENEGHGIESSTTEKWREYMVVCRESNSEEADFLLQMYKTRVIPAVEKQTKVKKRSKHEVPLSRKITKVNLYSSLDKTVVVWTQWRKGTRIFIMRPRSTTDAVEWYTFIRNILGWHRTSELQINIPDLDVSLLLDNPFERLESSTELAEAAEGNTEALKKTIQEEQAVAQSIIKRSLDLLMESDAYKDVIKAWSKGERIGLAWRRYDRLEWVHGNNEKKMYGSMAMQKTHELELRPKEHYSTKAQIQVSEEPLKEPAPVEGFLIRLTSQRGLDQRLGRMFFKRLYFSTHNQYLVFSRPAKAMPPPPPKFPASKGPGIPTAREITEGIPIIYAVNPYPISDGQIDWLRSDDLGTPEDLRHHDRDAFEESKRNSSILLAADGYINLCNVKKVRKVQRGATAADENIDEGSDVDFDADVEDTMGDDGVTTEFDDDRTFEMVLRNGLIVRLQAYNEETKKEWIHRLRDLVKYWKHRSANDIELLKTVRSQNLHALGIDEETEAIMGQFARKWEVAHTYASPSLYNMCGISACRTIHISGTLYRKPRRHGTFTRCSVILTSGHLLIFQDSLRKPSGKQIPHIHHEHVVSTPLKDCYLYSGFLTENDLLYQNRTFDNNKPGNSALPRLWREDGWTSVEGDGGTAFSLWYGRKKSLFRREGKLGGDGKSEGEREGKKSRFKVVSQLGTTGNTVVFKARSRAERDHWVLAIQTEIERMVEGEEVRFVGVE